MLKKVKHEVDAPRSPRPIMRLATFANASYGLVESTVGLLSGSSAALANGMHSVLDALSHGMHTDTHKHESKTFINNKEVQYRRKFAAGAIALGAFMTGVHSVHDLASHEQEPLNKPALFVELGSVAINTGLLLAIRRRNDGTLAYHDAFKHIKVDRTISVVTASSIALNPVLDYSDGVGGVFATVASFYLAKEILKHGDRYEIGSKTDSHAS